MDAGTLRIDFDGTICATAPAVRFSLERVFSELCLDIPNPTRLAVSIGSGLTLRETIQTIHQESDFSLGETLQLERRYREVYSSEGHRNEALYPGAVAVLEECARYATIVVLSNKGRRALEASVSRFGLGQHVRAVLAESPGTPRKPDVGLFNEVQRRIPGIRRDRSLVVGDTETDLRFARNVGLRSCWAAYGYGHHVRCKAIGYNYVLDQLEDLPTILQDWLHQRDVGPASPEE